MGADKTMARDSDCERRVDVGRHTYLYDQSSPPATILWLRNPLTRRRQECVHLGFLQDQTGVAVCVNETHCHFHRSRWVQFGLFQPYDNQ